MTCERTRARSAVPQQISNRTRLSLSDIYPYVSGIGAEYFLATRSKNRIKSIAMQHVPLDDGSRFRLTARLNRQPGDTTSYNPRGFKVLKGFTRDSQDQDKFVGPALPASCGPDSNSYRSHFVHFLVYGFEPQGNLLFTPYSARRLLLPDLSAFDGLTVSRQPRANPRPRSVVFDCSSRLWGTTLHATAGPAAPHSTVPLEHRPSADSGFHNTMGEKISPVATPRMTE